MELRHLRYFVATAEEQHFGRAARRLNVAEPTLSLQIRQLERELGVQLFERLSRGVRLTMTGLAFLDDARRTLVCAQEAVDHARRIGRGEVGALRVGRIPDSPMRASTGEVIGRLIAAFRVRYPEVEMETAHSTSADQWLALRDRRIDVALAFSPPEGAAGLRSEVLAEFWLTGALLPAAHPLASKAAPLACRDLRALPLLLYRRDAHPLLHDVVVRGLRERGLEPRLAQRHYVSDLTMGIGMVAAGAGWIPFTAAAAEWAARSPGIAYRKWTDPPIPFALYLLWRESEHSIFVERFIRLARELRAGPTPPEASQAELGPA